MFSSRTRKLVALALELQDSSSSGGTLQQNLSSCFNTLEQFLFSSATVVSSIVLDEKTSSDSGNIVEIVANIMGIKDVDSVTPNSTLIELGMDSIMAVEIKQALERNMEVNLTAEHLRGLTFSKLKELAAKQAEGENSTSALQTEDTTSEEISKTDILIPWSGFSSDDWKPILNCRQSSETTPDNQVFVFPAIEGNSLGVKSLMDNLESNVYCLQFDNDESDQSYRGISKRLLPHVINQLGIAKTFNLVGYSYGGLVCLLVAHELEKLGLKGKICMVDSSPDVLQMWAKFFIPSNGTENEKGEFIGKFLDGFQGLDNDTITKIAKEAGKLSEWEQQVNYVLDNVDLGSSIDREVVRNSLIAQYGRIKGIDEFDTFPDKSLNSPCILIKSTKMSSLGLEDYGLSKLFKLPVKIYAVEGTHNTILKELRTSNLINSFFNFITISSEALEK